MCLWSGIALLIFNDEERPYPPTAQMATQQGEALAKNLTALIRGGQMEPFQFQLRGTLASLGRSEGMGVIGKRKVFGGTAAIMKRLNDARWLYKIGGLSLVFRKGI